MNRISLDLQFMIPVKYITLKHLLIDNQKQIGLKYKPDQMIDHIVENLPNVQWSKEFGLPYILNTNKNISLLYSAFKGIAWVNGSSFFNDKPIKDNQPLDIGFYRNRKLPPGYRPCPEEFLLKLELKRYSLNTAKTYINCFEAYLNYFKESNLLELDETDIRAYLKHLVDLGKSESYINQSINSIKFYYEMVLGMPNRFYSIERPFSAFTLPTVLSMEEVNNMINSTSNIKHRCIIGLIYAAGLRRSELLSLKIPDIDSKRMLIKVNNGKGKKDRYTLLGEKILQELRQYYLKYRPQEYLFEGQKGKKYSETSVAKIVKRAAQRAAISKKVTPHTLRHSFATHLYEDDVNLRTVQVLLGHSSSKTTEIYTHVANNVIAKIKSPIDSLNL